MAWMIYLTAITTVQVMSIEETPTLSRVREWPKYDERLTAAARDLDAPPRYECNNKVHCRGEPLSTPIYWQGRQWAVTPFGIERRDGCYTIGQHRLWEDEWTAWGGWVTIMGKMD
jgi:hypothetical protein